jgi:Exopolyphosphatase
MLTDGVKVEKQLNTTRLAENMGNNGTLQPTNLERSAQAVAEYYYRALSRGAEDAFIFATEAVRSARNKNVFWRA